MPPVFNARVEKILVMFLLVSFLVLEGDPLLPAQAAAAPHQVSKALPASLPVGTQPNRLLPHRMLANPAVGIGSIWINKGLEGESSIFHIGDRITFMGWFYNNTGKSQTAPTVWEVKGPCEPLYTSNGDYIITENGYVLSYSTILTADVCGGRYVMTISVTFQGSTTSQSKSFFIINPANQKGGLIFLPFIRK